ncbi:MAG TPA: hypothetical protein VEX60_07500, partial [Pyrinomonadaceae bacterium]|nr:hypothetical protein [Pyrinomonadaceae bacterium]
LRVVCAPGRGCKRACVGYCKERFQLANLHRKLRSVSVTVIVEIKSFSFYYNHIPHTIAQIFPAQVSTLSAAASRSP